MISAASRKVSEHFGGPYTWCLKWEIFHLHTPRLREPTITIMVDGDNEEGKEKGKRGYFSKSKATAGRMLESHGGRDRLMYHLRDGMRQALQLGQMGLFL